jgi:hypothetical protein
MVVSFRVLLRSRSSARCILPYIPDTGPADPRHQAASVSKPSAPLSGAQGQYAGHFADSGQYRHSMMADTVMAGTQVGKADTGDRNGKSSQGVMRSGPYPVLPR